MNTENNSVEMAGLSARRPDIGYPRAIGFALTCALPLVLAWDVGVAVYRFMAGSQTFSQDPLIPILSAFLIYLGRKKVFSDVSFAFIPGLLLLAPGTIFVVLARINPGQLALENQFSLLVLGIVLSWAGAFVLFFGMHAFRAARFALGFLIFAIPIPEPVLSKITFFLQASSADVAEWFFRLGGIPYLRKEFVFVLPGVAIRVADECSGIHSSLALLITTALAGHLFLRSAWRKVLLCVVVIPLAILKNGLRITTLSALSIYVNPGFLYGDLHRKGGIVFFMIVLIPMLILLMYLQRGESVAAESAASAVS